MLATKIESPNLFNYITIPLFYFPQTDITKC